MNIAQKLTKIVPKIVPYESDQIPTLLLTLKLFSTYLRVLVHLFPTQSVNTKSSLLLSHSYDNSYLVVNRFHEYLVARGSLTEVVDQKFSPYTWTHKQDGTPIYEIMAQYPERLKVFQMGMTYLSTLEDTVGFYDFDQLKTSEDENKTILVDVGGGAGYAIRAIMAAHPDLAARPDKFVLQDLPEPIAHARTAGTQPDGVVKMEHDFFTEQPVKGLSFTSCQVQT
jgi:hypothetical protein